MRKLSFRPSTVRHPEAHWMRRVYLLLDLLGERRSSSEELEECLRGEGGERGRRPEGDGGLMRVTNCSGRPSPTETGVSPSCANRNEPNLSNTILPLRTYRYKRVNYKKAIHKITEKRNFHITYDIHTFHIHTTVDSCVQMSVIGKTFFILIQIYC